MRKYNSPCASLRKGQLNRLADRIKDRPVVTEDTCRKVPCVGPVNLHDNKLKESQ